MRAFALLLLSSLAAGCGRSAPPPAPESTVHTLRLPEEDVRLPDAPGRATVQALCIACHSPRYVLDQPPLPRKTWKAEVEKMRATYGASVAPGDVDPIVEYLVAIRGSGS